MAERARPGEQRPAPPRFLLPRLRRPWAGRTPVIRGARVRGARAGVPAAGDAVGVAVVAAVRRERKDRSTARPQPCRSVPSPLRSPSSSPFLHPHRTRPPHPRLPSRRRPPHPGGRWKRSPSFRWKPSLRGGASPRRPLGPVRRISRPRCASSTSPAGGKPRERHRKTEHTTLAAGLHSPCSAGGVGPGRVGGGLRCGGGTQRGLGSSDQSWTAKRTPTEVTGIRAASRASAVHVLQV
jgi:hypothetical protein